MNLNRNGKIARLPDRLGEEGEWKVEDGDAMNRAKSSLIVVNQGKSRLGRPRPNVRQSSPPRPVFEKLIRQNPPVLLNPSRGGSKIFYRF
jgi:hypothetical protein